MNIHFTFKISIILLFTLLGVNSYAQNIPSITLNIETAGSLSKLLGDRYKEIQDLTLSGEINASDIQIIRNMENLKSLNLDKINIKEGGKFSYSYRVGRPETGYKTHTEYRETSDNEIPYEMLYQANCKKLETLILPESVTKIKFGAFRNYENALSNLTFIQLGNNIIEIESGAFAYLEKLKSIILPSSLTSIYIGTFCGCRGLDSIYIPNSVTKIGGYSSSYLAAGAFAYCESLTSITIPNSVTEIADGSFTECTSLKSIEVSADNPSYVSKEGVLFTKDETTLIAYPNLKGRSYTIPGKVIKVEDYAFYKCANLEQLYIKQITPPEAGKNSFKSMSNNCTLYVPKGLYTSYWIAEGWRTFKNIIENDIETGNEIITAETVRITVIDGIVNLYSDKKIDVYIFNINGQLIKQQVMQGNVQLNLPNDIYIIKAGNQNQKVIIK